MVDKKEGWIDVGDLLPRVSIHDIADHFRFELGETFGSSGEQRTRCPVVACDGHDDFRSASIKVDDPKGKWKCHRSGYGCGGQGDKLTLIHVLETGAMPAGKLIGQDFRKAAATLLAIAGGAPPSERPEPPKPTTKKAASVAIDDQPNTPLSQSENEAIRRLANLDERLTLDVSEMTPQARRYMQAHDWMSETNCQQARCGFLPKKEKGTLRGMWVFPVLDEEGEPLSWVGRDLDFETKNEAWERSGRRDKAPAKYRFPSRAYFRRKFELFGQEILADTERSEILKQIGLTVTEGFNDVLKLRTLGVPSVGIMSNRMTPEQLSKIVRLAETCADGKVNIMLDADLRGDEGAKDMLWQLAQNGLAVRLAWSREMHDGVFKDREAEGVTQKEWQTIQTTLAL